MLVGTCFYLVKRGYAEELHHPVQMVSAVHARAGVGGSTGAIAVTSSHRLRLGCCVRMLEPGMMFGTVSACGDQRDSSVLALGYVLAASAPNMDTGGGLSAFDSLGGRPSCSKSTATVRHAAGTLRTHLRRCGDPRLRFAGTANSVLSLCPHDTDECRSRTAPPRGAPHGAGLVL